MRAFVTGLLAVAAALAAGPAQALNQDDYISAMGMMWRLQDSVCPGVSFDAAAFAKGIGLHGDPATIRRRHAKSFDSGYAKGTELIDEGGTAEYCQTVTYLFDGRHDFSGALKENPDKPAPGLTVTP